MLLRIRVDSSTHAMGKRSHGKSAKSACLHTPTLLLQAIRPGPKAAYNTAHALLNKHACDRLSTPMLQTFSTSVFRRNAATRSRQLEQSQSATFQ